jgi:hypothetical protein
MFSNSSEESTGPTHRQKPESMGEIHGRFSSLEKLLKMTKKNDGTFI